MTGNEIINKIGKINFIILFVSVCTCIFIVWFVVSSFQPNKISNKFSGSLESINTLNIKSPLDTPDLLKFSDNVEKFHMKVDEIIKNYPQTTNTEKKAIEDLIFMKDAFLKLKILLGLVKKKHETYDKQITDSKSNQKNLEAKINSQVKQNDLLNQQLKQEKEFENHLVDEQKYILKYQIDASSADGAVISTLVKTLPKDQGGGKYYLIDQCLAEIWSDYETNLNHLNTINLQADQPDSEFHIPSFITLTTSVLPILSVIGVVLGGIAAFNTWNKSIENREKDMEIREEDLRWRKANSAREIAASMYESQKAIYAMQMLESYERSYTVNNNIKKINKMRMLEAIERINIKKSRTSAQYEVDRFIYDCFDHFFSSMHEFQHYIDTKLIEFEDATYPFTYYAPIMYKWRELFEGYLQYHFPSECYKFLSQFRPWQAVKFEPICSFEKTDFENLFEMPQFNEALSSASLRETDLLVIFDNCSKTNVENLKK